jgi:uncharacterized protein involved in exopolysaccharide biosynthesis
MAGNSDLIVGIVRRHLDALAVTPSVDGTEWFVRVLETLRDLCLELPDLPLGADGDLARRVLGAANQMVLGLLYHLAGDADGTPGLEELQRQIETRLQQMHADQEQVAAQKQRLRVLDADLETLREERRLLEAIAGYEQLREQLRSKHADQAAYHHLLAGAAHRAARERTALDELDRQVEGLLTQQRQLLQRELQAEEASWQAVEREVFRT